MSEELMAEEAYLDPGFANAEEPKIVPSYIANAFTTSAILVASILHPQAADVQAKPFIEPALEEGGVIEEYRAGRTRSLKDFMAELEARGEI
jgi:hypothetical protein